MLKGKTQSSISIGQSPGARDLILTDEVRGPANSDENYAATSLHFSDADLDVYGFLQLDVLEEVLEEGDPVRMHEVRNAISRKIGRVSGNDDERAFLEAYSNQLRARLGNPPLFLSAKVDGLSGSADQSGTKGNWVWWTSGLFLLLAYCNYSDRDQRPESTTNALVGLTAGQAAAYRECMSGSAGYNISDYSRSHICSQSVAGLDTGLKCSVEWDGRNNPTVCE